MNNIEVLLERLRSLQIMNKASGKTYKQSNKEMFVVQVPATMNDNTQCYKTRVWTDFRVNGQE